MRTYLKTKGIGQNTCARLKVGMLERGSGEPERARRGRGGSYEIGGVPEGLGAGAAD